MVPAPIPASQASIRLFEFPVLPRPAPGRAIPETLAKQGARLDLSRQGRGSAASRSGPLTRQVQPGRMPAWFSGRGLAPHWPDPLAASHQHADGDRTCSTAAVSAAVQLVRPRAVRRYNRGRLRSLTSSIDHHKRVRAAPECRRTAGSVQAQGRCFGGRLTASAMRPVMASGHLPAGLQPRNDRMTDWQSVCREKRKTAWRGGVRTNWRRAPIHQITRIGRVRPRGPLCRAEPAHAFGRHRSSRRSKPHHHPRPVSTPDPAKRDAQCQPGAKRQGLVRVRRAAADQGQGQDIEQGADAARQQDHWQ